MPLINAIQFSIFRYVAFCGIFFFEDQASLDIPRNALVCVLIWELIVLVVEHKSKN